MGFRVDYHDAFDCELNTALVPTFDYYLYLGLDEGAMGFVDALAAGVPTIVTPQGYHLDAPRGITHPFRSLEELVEVFHGIASRRNQLVEAVAGWTWKDYAIKHLELWRWLLAGRDAALVGSSRYPDGLGSVVQQRPTPQVPREPGYSFCIITNGKRPEKLAREIESIRALGIPDFEILVGGNPPSGPAFQGLRTVRLVDAADNGRLGEMRNALCRAARYDHLVVADDDMLFHADYYEGLKAFGEDYDVLCVRLLNPDGTRYWDWATHGGPTGHRLLAYDETDPHVYVTGGLCILKAHVFDRVQWDEHRGFYQHEDVDFSERLKEAGFRIRFCRASTVTHNDPSVTQLGDLIIKYQERIELGSPLEAAEVRGFYGREGETCWMGGHGELVFPASLFAQSRVLHLNLTCAEARYYPRFPFGLTLTFDGQAAGRVDFPEANYTLSLSLNIPRRESGFTLGITSDVVFVPCEVGFERDMRRLSVRLSGLRLEKG